MKSIYFFISVLILYSGVLSAAILKKEMGKAEIEKVKLATAASLSFQEKNWNLKPVGAGLRAKKVILVNVNVYVAELYVSDVNKLEKSQDKILNSLGQMEAAVMQLTFLRDVEGEKVKTSFNEALKANHIDQNDPAVKTILDSVVKGGKVKKGETLTFAVVKATDNKETLLFEASTGEVSQASGSGLAKTLFSIWLGEPADSGVKNLKESLLKAN